MTYEEQIRHDFETKKYAHLINFLDKENCAQLTTELKRLVKQGKTRKDEQCPISQAVHGAPVFDSLLEQLTPAFEIASGKKLFPTYAYARLYAPGEELKVHTDRESCEISATITLGFEGDVWPIYVGDYTDDEDSGEEVITQQGETKYIINKSKIEMEVGDAVIYRGMDKVHWRRKYKQGQWQAQVFLHYVDQNGPHASWKYDKRDKLSHYDTVETQPQEVDYTFWVFKKAISPEACKRAIENVEKSSDGEEAQIGMGTNGVVNKEIRDVKRITMPAWNGIGAQMVGMGIAANQQAWKFNITHSNQCDYLRYDNQGHYKAHVDTFISPNDPETRKLTVLVFLNDDFEGGKLFLQNGHGKIYPPQEAGTVLVFPSFMLHGVEPVTSGVRRSIVTWLVGPWFK